MSADVLRQAAALMRSQAENAESGRWKLWGMSVMADPKGTSDVDDAILVAVAATPSWSEPMPRTWNATHIASWHPAVALAVADWLEVFAESEWPYCDCGDDDCTYGPCVAQRQALTVARTYLGATS